MSPPTQLPLTTSRWSLLLAIVCLQFCQLWTEVAGFTLRTDDVLLLLLLALTLLPTLLRLRWHRRPSVLTRPILVWQSALIIGIGVTLFANYDATTSRDALVSGLRLVLMLTLFWVVYNHPLSAAQKTRSLVLLILITSIATTLVSLLQIAYWEGFSVPLPQLLTQLKEDANQARGREIFGLFIGNTGTHVWSTLLSLQALIVWVSCRQRPAFRPFGLPYFGLLVLILIRISVRNSVFGLASALFTITILESIARRRYLNRLAGISVLFISLALGLAVVASFSAESFFIERIQQTIPQFRDGQLQVDPRSNIRGRLVAIEDAYELYRANPMMGGGFWSYTVLTSQPLFTHVHNSYLQTLAELGSLGAVLLLFYLAAIGRFLRHSWQRLHQTSSTEAQITLYIALGWVVFVLITALFANPLWEPSTTLMLMVWLGVLASTIGEAT